jgi:hypothetical protein
MDLTDFRAKAPKIEGRPHSGAVEKVGFYPPTPQGGLYNYLSINKSPLGDLGVYEIKRTFSTLP